MNPSMRYVLDSSSLIRRPVILAMGRARKLIVPQSVVEEVSRFGGTETKNATKKLFEMAKHEGLAVVEIPSSVEKEITFDEKELWHLSNTDIDIARIALSYADRFGRANVCVVTDDRELADFMASRGIAALHSAAFIHGVEPGSLDHKLQKSAEKLISLQWRQIVISVLLGLASSILGNLGYSHFGLIVRTISVWGVVIAVPISGLFLFWMRHRFRLSYGVFEYCVGLIMSYRTLLPHFNHAELGIAWGIQALGGLYVMVRGLDNISKGVEGTRFQAIWQKFLRNPGPA